VKLGGWEGPGAIGTPPGPIACAKTTWLVPSVARNTNGAKRMSTFLQREDIPFRFNDHRIPPHTPHEGHQLLEIAILPAPSTQSGNSTEPSTRRSGRCENRIRIRRF
jgi:hypothetical protein